MKENLKKGFNSLEFNEHEEVKATKDEQINKMLNKIAEKQHQKTAPFVGRAFAYEKLKETDQNELYQIEKTIKRNNNAIYEQLYKAYRMLCCYKTGTFWHWFESVFQDQKEMSKRTADNHIRVIQTRKRLEDKGVGKELIEIFNDQFLKVQIDMYRMISWKGIGQIKPDISPLVKTLKDLKRIGSRLSVNEFRNRFAIYFPPHLSMTDDDYSMMEFGVKAPNPKKHNRIYKLLKKELDPRVFEVLWRKGNENGFIKEIEESLRITHGFAPFEQINRERKDLLEIFEIVENMAQSFGKSRSFIYKEIHLVLEQIQSKPKEDDKEETESSRNLSLVRKQVTG